MDVPRARQVAAPGWLNVRTVVGLLLFALAFLGGQRVLSEARASTGVWVAARDLPYGSTLGPDDVMLREVRLPVELEARYVRSDLPMAGSVVTQAVRAGELIPTESVGTGAAAQQGRVMTIPVTPEHAVGGLLRPGDIVDVFATFDAGDVRARTVLLVRGVEVLNLVETGGLVLDEGSLAGIDVAVSPAEAARLAFAIRSAELDVVKVEGRPDEAGPATVRTGDFP